MHACTPYLQYVHVPVQLVVHQLIGEGEPEEELDGRKCRESVGFPDLAWDSDSANASCQVFVQMTSSTSASQGRRCGGGGGGDWAIGGVVLPQPPPLPPSNTG